MDGGLNKRNSFLNLQLCGHDGSLTYQYFCLRRCGLQKPIFGRDFFDAFCFTRDLSRLESCILERCLMRGHDWAQTFITCSFNFFLLLNHTTLWFPIWEHANESDRLRLFIGNFDSSSKTKSHWGLFLQLAWIFGLLAAMENVGAQVNWSHRVKIISSLFENCCPAVKQSISTRIYPMKRAVLNDWIIRKALIPAQKSKSPW